MAAAQADGPLQHHFAASGGLLVDTVIDDKMPTIRTVHLTHATTPTPCGLLLLRVTRKMRARRGGNACSAHVQEAVTAAIVRAVTRPVLLYRAVAGTTPTA
ncbi:MAG TPA: hypothetical protein VF221_00560 [Chloroflexota bacterium]